jgi:uncharacterized protein (TIGR02271 family)
MDNTVIGVYDSYAQAENAVNELISCGFSRTDVQLNPDSATAGQTADTRTADTEHESGIGHFFRTLFGMEDEHREHRDIYSEAVRRGSSVVTVYAKTEEERERAVEVMNRHDPVDIDERAEHWRSQGWSGYDEKAPIMTPAEIERDRSEYVRNRNAAPDTTQTAAMQNTDRAADQTGKQTIPVVEEELKVGKREVQRGGVRVYQRVQEKPVEESVQLRQEHVNVERHPVDQPVTGAQLDALKEGSIEVREMAEEPVVSKTARVVEEVTIGKDVTEETKNIKDTVRRSDVEVEQLGTSDARMARSDIADTNATIDDTDYRRHWQSAYGQAGGRYEDYDAAYRYGANLGGNERFKNYRWTDVEGDVRTDWERDHPESAWDKVKDAVRYGAERVTGHRH